MDSTRIIGGETMSNKTQLQENNTNLETIKTEVLGLPNADDIAEAASSG